MNEKIEACYRLIQQHQDQPIWIHLESKESTHARAKILLERKNSGQALPLYGKLFAVKDNIDVADIPTTAGCPDYAYTPRRSAFVVEKALEAGALFIGKTNLDQFATGLVGTRSPYGICRNAFNADYISGGSSSGSALAVALEMVDFSLGTDTAGSGRVPAALNEIIGYKPTKGLLSTAGVIPACRTLDCVSIFAKSLNEIEEVAPILSVYDEKDSFSRSFINHPKNAESKWRFGVPYELNFEGDAEAEVLYKKAIHELEKKGGQAVLFDYNPFAEAARLLYEGPWVAERYAAVGKWMEQHLGASDPVVEAIILKAVNLSATDAFNAFYKLSELKRLAEKSWNLMDVMVLPTVPTVYKIRDIHDEPLTLNSKLGTYTNFVNLFDLSALTIPAGRWSFGVPYGLSLIAPAFQDALLFEWAKFFQGSAAVSRPKERQGVKLAVVGAHLRGQPLHHQLITLNAVFVEATRTSPNYRLYALEQTNPPKPGMSRDSTEGKSIEVEIYELTEESLGALIKLVPAPLCIGTVELEDRSSVKGFLCENYILKNAKEITQHGSWIAYLSSCDKAFHEN